MFGALSVYLVSVGWPVAHAASAASSAGLRILMMLPEDLQDSPFFTNKKTYSFFY